MTKTNLLGKFAFATGLVLAASSTFAAGQATPKSFVAQYQVLQDGQELGHATLTLKSVGNGEYTYTGHSEGTGGMAAMLGANVDEASRFRWTANGPEAISYDYKMDASIKSKERHLKVAGGKVTVDNGNKNYQFAAVPGMVERNILALTLGSALAQGKQTVTLPVAGKSSVEQQSFKVTGKETIKVPAGSFSATKMERTDADRGFTAWYVPGKYVLPVKLTQTDGGNIELQLVSYKAE
jgi:hypothetical protein